MKVLFIRPNPNLNNTYHKSFFSKFQGRLNAHLPFLTFPMLAAVTPDHHTITIFDERYQDINYDYDCDLVGITTMTNDATRAYHIADEFRKRGIPVILGGCHPSALPKEAKQHADSVVIGEAEEIWPQVLKDFEQNELQTFYHQLKPIDLKYIPKPRRDLMIPSFIATSVQSSRGCPHGCKFCFVTNSEHGRIFRKRSIDKIIEEIKQVPQRLIFFYDSSLTIDVEFTKSLFKAMIGLKKKCICLGNIDILSKDEKLLALSKDAGCLQWHIGFESISSQTIEEIGKKTNQINNYLKTVKNIHKYGMNVHGYFIFGFDNDTKKSFDDTLQFVKKAELDSADFCILTPLPGTPIYDDLLKQGRILIKDWAKYTYQTNVVFKPKNLTEDELLQGIKQILKEYYSYSSILQRLSKMLKRGILNFHVYLFILDNVFTRYYYMKYLR